MRGTLGLDHFQVNEVFETFKEHAHNGALCLSSLWRLHSLVIVLRPLPPLLPLLLLQVKWTPTVFSEQWRCWCTWRD